MSKRNKIIIIITTRFIQNEFGNAQTRFYNEVHSKRVLKRSNTFLQRGSFKTSFETLKHVFTTRFIQNEFGNAQTRFYNEVHSKRVLKRSNTFLQRGSFKTSFET